MPRFHHIPSLSPDAKISPLPHIITRCQVFTPSSHHHQVPRYHPIYSLSLGAKILLHLPIITRCQDFTPIHSLSPDAKSSPYKPMTYSPGTGRLIFLMKKRRIADSVTHFMHIHVYNGLVCSRVCIVSIHCSCASSDQCCFSVSREFNAKRCLRVCKETETSSLKIENILHLKVEQTNTPSGPTKA